MGNYLFRVLFFFWSRFQTIIIFPWWIGSWTWRCLSFCGSLVFFYLLIWSRCVRWGRWGSLLTIYICTFMIGFVSCVLTCWVVFLIVLLRCLVFIVRADERRWSDEDDNPNEEAKGWSKIALTSTSSRIGNAKNKEQDRHSRFFNLSFKFLFVFLLIPFIGLWKESSDETTSASSADWKMDIRVSYYDINSPIQVNSKGLPKRETTHTGYLTKQGGIWKTWQVIESSFSCIILNTVLFSELSA